MSMVPGGLPSAPLHLWLWGSKGLCVELSPQNPGQWLQQPLKGICTESWNQRMQGISGLSLFLLWARQYYSSQQPLGAHTCCREPGPPGLLRVKSLNPFTGAEGWED